MPTISITEPNKAEQNSAWLSLGFRPFFLGAALFSSLSLLLWALIFHGFWLPPASNLSFSQAHAHEMLYGYGSAIIAGFLLTAVRNWTGIATLQNQALLNLFLFWLASRLLFLFPASQIFAVGLNILFLCYLAISLSIPLYKTKKWQQIGILSKVYLLVICEIIFLLGQLNYLDNGIHLGLYSGLYMILGLVIIMSNRVIPFFIERGVGQAFKVKPHDYLHVPALILFTLFFILDLFTTHYHDVIAIICLLLFAINFVRLYAWHHHGIWKNPMLWSLYLGYACLSFGFLGISLTHWFKLYPLLSFHLFTYGGIGLISLGMMARIALGHTGRDVNQPPKIIPYALSCLVIGVIIRVILPLFWMNHYSLWIGLSQGLWIFAFASFSFSYYPILTQKRLSSF